jgi:hypothetical protein
MKLLTTTAVAKRYGIHVGSVYRESSGPGSNAKAAISMEEAMVVPVMPYFRSIRSLGRGQSSWEA